MFYSALRRHADTLPKRGTDLRVSVAATTIAAADTKRRSTRRAATLEPTRPGDLFQPTRSDSD